MTDDQNTPENTPEVAAEKPAAADRIAKVMARAGVASRREAERMIVEGRVTVNGQKIDSPALDVLPSDRIVVDGKKLEEPQETRLWLYYKPVGLVTSEADEKGRQTVFDALPRDLPRVMSVGRLDLNSEGLLLLTNDGELKRRLELPETGWLRRYRVRVNGQPNDLTFAPLRRGVTIDGEEFAPMEIKLDSQQGANAWLTVGIREGKNREIRRAMAHVGLQVNRLIRIGYGPFKLTGLEENEVREVKRRVLRDQLGGLLTGETDEKERPFRARGADAEGRPPRRDARDGDRPERGRSFGARRGEDGDRPFGRRGQDGEARSFGRGVGKPYQRDDDRAERPRKPRYEGNSDRPARDGAGERGGKRPYEKRGDAPAKGFGRRDGAGERGSGRPYEKRGDAPAKGFGRRDGAGEGGAGRPYEKRGDGAAAKGFGRRDGARDDKPFGGRGDKRRDDARGDKPFARRGDKPQGERGAAPRGPGSKGFGGKDGGRPQRDRFKPGGPRGPRSGKPGGGGASGGPGHRGPKGPRQPKG